MGCQLQHSILYSYDVHIRSFTFEFCRFVSEIRITGVNIQYAEVRTVGWTKSARTLVLVLLCLFRFISRIDIIAII